LQEKVGYEELMAALARGLFALRGEYTLTPTMDAQLTGLAGVMLAEENAWQQEIADNELLIATLAYEGAQERLLVPPVIADAIDTDTSLPLNQTELEKDIVERVAANAVIVSAVPSTLALVTERQSARDAALEVARLAAEALLV
jgi:hypothetical protein